MQGAAEALAHNSCAAHPSSMLYPGCQARLLAGGRCRSRCDPELGAAHALPGRLPAACGMAWLEGYKAYRPGLASSACQIIALRLGGIHNLRAVASARRLLRACCARRQRCSAVRCARSRMGVREGQLLAHAQPGRGAQHRAQDWAPQELQRLVAGVLLQAEAAALVQPPRVTVVLRDLLARAVRSVEGREPSESDVQHGASQDMEQLGAREVLHALVSPCPVSALYSLLTLYQHLESCSRTSVLAVAGTGGVTLNI